MAHVEDDVAIRGGAYQRPLNYTYNRDLGGGAGGFNYVFNEGGLDCSVAAVMGDQRCICSGSEMTTIQRVRPSFVYLDVGSWVDNCDGNGLRRRDFGLVCGLNVYLCEFVQSGGVPTSRIPPVNRFFREIGARGHGIRVLRYMTLRPPVDPATPTDPNLYLFLGDLHLPPVSWFHTRQELAVTMQNRTPPVWLSNLPAWQRQRDYLIHNYYTASQIHREYNPGRPRPVEADIFRAAGNDLVRFLDALSNLSDETKRLLHFIQTGDMFELWLGRDYQYRPGFVDPEWLDNESVNRVSDWGLEVLIQNVPVFEAFNRLHSSGLAEVRYVWGNHDAYLKDRMVTRQLGLPERAPFYRGMNTDLWAEHGHRYDRSNFDNTASGIGTGPWGANMAYDFPVFRRAEPMARVVSSIGHPSTMIDCYLLGVTLNYLHERFDLNQKPFGIFIMGHSHIRQLFRYDIQIRYQNFAVP